MSDTSLTIPKIPKLENSENYEFLRQAGIQYIQKLSGRIWTDYNRHDPGISIHELLCYALTDLGYRTSFEIPDLLAIDKDATPVEALAGFFTAAEILPVNPTSEIDLRKLVIDTPGVRNAWIITAKDSEYPVYFDHKNCELTIDPLKGDKLIPLQGLYNILLEYEKDDKGKEFYDTINAEVRAAVMSHRNLCEDLLSITAVGYEDIAVCADIEVKQYADIDVVQAKIYKILIDYFTPSANFYTLEEMLEGEADKKDELTGEVLTWKRAPKSIDEIFEGPLLKHGFIDDDELADADLRAELHVSDVINSIMDVDGVIAVKTISFLKYLDGEVTDVQDWIMPLGQLHAPRLSRDKSKFIFYKGVLPYMAHKESVDQELRELQQTNEAFRKTGHTRDLPVPEGEFRSLTDYYPVQNDFPLVYGIGEIGLSGSVTEKRQAQAKQLKAYLLLFEQILANYLAQLANLKRLFSIDPTITKLANKTFAYDGEKNRTYYTQQLKEIRMFQEKEVIVSLLTSTDRDARDEYRNQLIDLFDFKYLLLIEWMTETDGARIAAWRTQLDELFADGEYDIAALEALRGTAAFSVKRTALIKEIYDDVNDELTGKHYEKALNEMAETESIFIDRRNRFMDHLMARFCEQMTDYSLIVKQMMNDETQSGMRLINDKERFLSDYTIFSRDRGKGFNYKYPHPPVGNPMHVSNGIWNTDNVSGMKHRIVRLLGMDEHKRRTLATEFLTIKLEVILGESMWHVALADPLHPSVTLMTSLKYDTEECAESTLLYMLHEGDNENKYEIKGAPGNYYYVLNNDCDDVEVIATSVKTNFLTREKCDEEMQRVIQFFRDNCDVESFHLVEHILLRPRTNLDIPLPGCVTCATGTIPVSEKNIPAYLFHIRLLTQEERDKSPMHPRQKRKDRWKFELHDRDGKIILNSEGYVELNGCTNGIDSLRQHGISKSNYHLSKSKTFRGFSLFADNGQLIAKSKNYPDAATRDEELHKLISFFAYKDDVWHTEDAASEEMVYCGDDDDPYSFQLSVILPAWPTRFRNIAFRQFIEKTIRLETPAHIHPKICWVDLEQMRKFEHAYKKWVGGMITNDIPNPHTSRKLIKALYNLDNVYPAALLHSCDDISSNEPQVILDYTSLGNL
ncbi:MAG: YegP family protein [Bacteroidia bacterium]